MKKNWYFKDIKGNRYGRLVVISKTTRRVRKHTVWKCKCDCGNMVYKQSQNLIRGSTKSCGCFHRDRDSKVHSKHNHSSRNGVSKNSPTYSSWCSMKARCSYPKNPSYPYYGGRGIKVCARWINSFTNFLKDMGERPNKNWSIDRINSDGNYEPSNCRWLLASENSKRASKNNKKPAKK